MSHVVIDTSTWSRRGQTDVAEAVADAVESARATLVTPVLLELLRSAVGDRDLVGLAADYDHLPTIELTPAIEARSLAVQAQLARRGQHRGPSPVDLLTAAAAESVGAVLWHCDRHFELIAGVTGQPVRRLGR